MFICKHTCNSVPVYVWVPGGQVGGWRGRTLLPQGFGTRSSHSNASISQSTCKYRIFKMPRNRNFIMHQKIKGPKLERRRHVKIDSK